VGSIRDTRARRPYQQKPSGWRAVGAGAGKPLPPGFRARSARPSPTSGWSSRPALLPGPRDRCGRALLRGPRGPATDRPRHYRTRDRSGAGSAAGLPADPPPETRLVYRSRYLDKTDFLRSKRGTSRRPCSLAKRSLGALTLGVAGRGHRHLPGLRRAARPAHATERSDRAARHPAGWPDRSRAEATRRHRVSRSRARSRSRGVPAPTGSSVRVRGGSRKAGWRCRPFRGPADSLGSEMPRGTPKSPRSPPPVCKSPSLV